MGIVLKQSLRNTMITYMGFGIGALNTLFLYTHILSDAQYGLVTFILATAAILMPLMAFGVQNSFVKYYTAQPDSAKDGFLTLMLLAPLVVLLPLTILVWVFYENIAGFVSQENELVFDYVWHVFLVGLAMAYFEVFYAWSKVHLRSVFGNFMKELFARLGVTVLLALYYFGHISLDFFFQALVGLYLLRTLVMKIYAFSLRRPRLLFKFPKHTPEIMSYSFLIILGGSAALILLEIDKFMINQLLAIENVAYYGVAIYIATVIIVPSRSMHHITYPLTAELLHQKDWGGLVQLYRKSSLTLFIASGLLFLLIVLNLHDLYRLLPESYRGGFFIVFLIGLAKVFDSLLGNINSILYNSRYYKTVLLMGVGLAALTILLNLWLIPKLGIEGAALASFSAIFLFNLIKLGYVHQKFEMLPFTGATLKVFLILAFLGGLLWFLGLPFHPLINIFLKSILISAVYLIILDRFKISEDVSGLLSKLFQKFRKSS